MKRITLTIAALAFISAIITSCKKDYTCQCTRTYTKSNGTTITESDGLYTFTDSKVRAADRCQQQEGSGSDLSGSYTRDCDLK